MTFLLLIAALAAGTANPFQSGTNAELNKQLGSPMWAGLLVYCSGLVTLILIQFALRIFSPANVALPVGARFASVPWWAWTGGAVSIISTVVALTTAQKLGSGVFTGASITASLVTSVVLDHFGLIGFKQHAASPMRLAGCAVMVAGLWMVAKF